MPIRSASQKKVYTFVHRSDEYIKTNLKIDEAYHSENGFLDIFPNGLIQINGSCHNGYAWDGCTPKWEILDFVVGTPDGRLDYLTEKPITYFASLLHDALYQYKAEVPLSRKTADLIFGQILREAGFRWWWLYLFGVRIGGLFFGRWCTSRTPESVLVEECSWVKNAANTHIAQKQSMQSHPLVKTAKKY